MIDLNDREAIKKIDPQDTLGTTELMADQLEAAWQQVQALDLPKITGVKNIVFCGMGASIYGALVIRSLLGSKFPYPTEVVTDYHLPGYVDKNTLVVLTSYSGSTEEVLSCADEAKAKGAHMMILTKGEKLAEFAKENNVPSYIFDGKLNPASVPRLGNGYSIIGLMGLLLKTGVVSFDTKQLEEAIKLGKSLVPEIKKHTQEHAKVYQGWIPIIFAAEHLSGNAQILRNQFNETSKQFSAYYLVPDLNHHLMEGLAFPEDSKLRFYIFDSKNYSPKIQKRMELTLEVVQQNNHTSDYYATRGKNIFEDFVEVLLYGSFLTLYLGLVNNQNPATNPWVDWFKDKLKSS